MSIITSAGLAGHLGIEDSDDDLALTRAADAANSAVARHCGFPLRQFDKTDVVDASVRYYQPDNQCRLYVTDFWETSALQVHVDFADNGSYGTTWTLNTHFLLEPMNATADGEPYTTISPITSYFPTYNRRPSVKVTAAWGWPEIHPDVAEAALIKAAKLFKRKDSIDGVLGGFADFGAVRISTREDPDVVSLLQPFKRNERAVHLA